MNICKYQKVFSIIYDKIKYGHSLMFIYIFRIGLTVVNAGALIN